MPPLTNDTISEEFKKKLPGFDPENGDCWKNFYVMDGKFLERPFTWQKTPGTSRERRDAYDQLLRASEKGQLFYAAEKDETPRMVAMSYTRENGIQLEVTDIGKEPDLPEEPAEVKKPSEPWGLTKLLAQLGIGFFQRRVEAYNKAEASYRVYENELADFPKKQKEFEEKAERFRNAKTAVEKFRENQKKFSDELKSAMTDREDRVNNRAKFEERMESVYGETPVKLGGNQDKLIDLFAPNTTYKVPDGMSKKAVRALVQIACADDNVKKKTYSTYGMEEEYDLNVLVHTRQDIMTNREDPDTRLRTSVSDARAMVKSALEQDTPEKRADAIGKIIGENLGKFVNYDGHMASLGETNIQALREDAAILELLQDDAIRKSALEHGKGRKNGLTEETIRSLEAERNFVDLMEKSVDAKDKLLHPADGQNTEELVADVLLFETVNASRAGKFRERDTEINEKTGERMTILMGKSSELVKKMEESLRKEIAPMNGDVDRTVEFVGKKLREMDAEFNENGVRNRLKKAVESNGTDMRTDFVAAAVSAITNGIPTKIVKDSTLLGQAEAINFQPDETFKSLSNSKALEKLRADLKMTATYKKLCEDVKTKGAENVLVDSERASVRQKNMNKEIIKSRTEREKAEKSLETIKDYRKKMESGGLGLG